MALGDDIKTAVDGVRNTLGTDCTYDGATALGKCSFAEISPAAARQMLGDDYQDEIDLPWAIIESTAGFSLKENHKITVTLTGQNWVIRRVMTAQAAGVKIAERCLCGGQLV